MRKSYRIQDTGNRSQVIGLRIKKISNYIYNW